MSVRKTVIFNTLSIELPASSSWWRMFSMAWRVCPSMSPLAISPVAWLRPTIPDRKTKGPKLTAGEKGRLGDSGFDRICLLYTSDAADDLLCVDLGGRRII